MTDEKKIRVLLVEDDKVDQMAFERLVKTENLPYEYTVASSVSGAVKNLSSEQFDVLITDLRLGDGTAFDFLHLIKEAPFIVVTGSGDEQFAVKAMKAGASDYLIKDTERNYLHLLPLTIEEVIRRCRIERCLREKENYIRLIHENVFSGIITIDTSGEIKSFNPASSRMFGYHETEVIGQNINLLMPAVFFTDEAAAYGYLKNGRVDIVDTGYETTALRKDGALFPIQFSISEIWSGGKNIYIIALMDITDRKKRETLLYEQAFQDGLTGLYNKRAMQTFLKEEIERGTRHQRPFSLLMLDIDHFKMVNDTYGHQAGDDVLREMAHVIRLNLRLTDKAFRYGGDEIVIMLPEIQLNNVAVFAERLRLTLASNPIMIEDNNGQKIQIGVTVSMGAAGFPENGDSAEALIAAADKALYEAKRRGRSCVVQFK